MSVNKVILMGHTGKAPDFREFDNGGCVATFSLATTKRGYTTKDGRQIPERTEWHNVVLQNGLAKVANQYVKKGGAGAQVPPPPVPDAPAPDGNDDLPF